MCLSARHLDILRRLNGEDFARGHASQETRDRFVELFERCAACPRFDNGAFGDVPSDCRQAFLRLFISMKRDAENYLLRQRFEAQARRASAGQPAMPVPAMAAPALPRPASLSLSIPLSQAAQGQSKKGRRPRKRAVR